MHTLASLCVCIDFRFIQIYRYEENEIGVNLKQMCSFSSVMVSSSILSQYSLFHYNVGVTSFSLAIWSFCFDISSPSIQNIQNDFVVPCFGLVLLVNSNLLLCGLISLYKFYFSFHIHTLAISCLQTLWCVHHGLLILYFYS